ncbi:MAG: site-2 protease family protein [Thermoplasmata archaeon]
MGVPLTSTPPPGTSELERLRATVSRHFPVYETHVGPQSVAFAVHVDRATLEPTFRELAGTLWKDGYVAVLRHRTGEDFVEIGRRPPVGRSVVAINAGLLAATVATTVLTGALIWLSYIGGSALTAGDFLNGAAFFAAPLLAILGGHELSHYVVARRYRLDASLPYFIPIPPPFLFGTLGAFISIRQPFPDRKALFDIGAAGPIAGFLIAIPVTLAGMYLSATGPPVNLAACGLTFLGTNYSSLLIGSSFLWFGLSLFFPTQLLSLHPLALAGWVGLFVTAINLLPAGQLDGGHVWRALLGEKARFLSYGIALFLVVLGFLAYFGWLVFAFLIVLLGLRHPPPLNDVSPLGARRTLVGLGVAAILVAGFTLVPVAVESGQLTTGSLAAVPVTLPGYPTAGNLSMNVTNGDPVAHGLVLSGTVTQVYLNRSGPPLNASAMAAWAEPSRWTVLVAGARYAIAGAGNFTVPGGAGYVTLNGSATLPVLVEFANPSSAAQVDVTLTIREVCPPPGASGTATATFALQVP